ncbi:PREDICTED: growth arrest-specific protein 7-like isoform X1 [Amphimedon queenslandica]|uniref:F-BAR domain-containing protein n=1 Tax=Amphimedon queenslandica TaxID=400682 RepID=A0A1X7V890_AMPQE|nr:PREDICTED: growth arrest-specific protein 7-like isoform X1 [Amphimedon queenslandica]|eukprot:XP_019850378.1 PREDICTED: growth arrest-specific protein 7-like isoform X1 [Amphimedon queenslandica]
MDIVRASYPYACSTSGPGGGSKGQLVFPEGAVLLVAERSDDGWCRGYSAGNQGWFPASYVSPITPEQLLVHSVNPVALNSILRSPSWTVYATVEGKLYYVNNNSKETSWTLPSPPGNSLDTLSVPTEKSPLHVSNGVAMRRKTMKEAEKPKKAKYRIVNGITFCIEGGEPQELMNPQAPSYIDYFWSDKGDRSGFDVIREKHVQGKDVIKEMMDFFKERAAIEEQYARNLNKLSKSTHGEQEEGTLLAAWKSLKAELRQRSEAHSKFASKITETIEKPLFEFKESQKTDRKHHEQLLEKSRKQLQSLDAAIDKAKQSLNGLVKTSGKMKRQSSINGDVKIGDDMKKLEATYNQAQRLWVDNMIAACRDFERHEEERSAYLKDRFLAYIDLCVEAQETTAQALTYSTNMVDNINKKADREFFIKKKGTGTLRPVDRVILET